MDTFFTADDLALLTAYHGRAYRARLHQTPKRELELGAWGKTKHWAHHLNLPGWEVKMRRLIVTGWGLDEAEKLVSGGVFQKYTWATIVPRNAREPRVYFTVGIDPGSKALVYKLDCQSGNNNRLSPQQLACFQQVRDRYDPTAGWRTIPVRQWSEYTWPRLLEETRHFILDRTELYNQLVEVVLHGDLSISKPGIGPSHRPAGASRRSYHIPEQLIESDDQHRRLQLQLVLDLKAEYPQADVYCEGAISPEGWFVDVVQEEPHRRVLYEIKTDPRLHLCLRSALGQLLQYAYWGNKKLATELIIASRHALDQEGAEFLSALRVQFGLPIGYRQVVLAA